MKTHVQSSPYASPWPLRDRVRALLWEACWTLCCRWTPKPLNAWRLGWLRVFGARIHGRPFVHQRARVQLPWNLTLRDRACLGDRAAAYTLGPIEVHEGATVAQEAYLCTGTHRFDDPVLPLQTAPIVIGAHAFIGLRAVILPGVTVGAGAVVGAGSLVRRDIAPLAIVAGNPARVIGRRPAAGLPAGAVPGIPAKS